MKGNLTYFLGDNKTGFIDRLKKDNVRYHLGYTISEDQQGFYVESRGGENIRIGLIGRTPCDFELKVLREKRDKFPSLDDQVDNLIAIADAYPEEVSRDQLRGVPNPELIDRHMTP
jgi:hypothetical protein